MSTTTDLPTWAVYAYGIGTPLLAFAGATLGHWIHRKGDREIETRWRREQALSHMRWAVELITSDSQQLSEVGGAALAALAQSPLLHDDDLGFIAQVTEAALSYTLDEAGDLTAEVVEIEED